MAGYNDKDLNWDMLNLGALKDWIMIKYMFSGNSAHEMPKGRF